MDKTHSFVKKVGLKNFSKEVFIVSFICATVYYSDTSHSFVKKGWTKNFNKRTFIKHILNEKKILSKVFEGLLGYLFTKKLP